MEVTGKVHCFFEQSGTFKNEFIKLGIPAEDYDIQNNFGETDNVVDLFQAIEDAYENKPSLFDKIGGGDLIVAFFPCIYFCENNQLYFCGTHHNLSKMSAREKAETILQRSRNRQYFYELCLKMFTVCTERDLCMVMENPYAKQHYLVGNFMYKATVIDIDRTRRGDFFKKPTQYWFVNCTPTNGATYATPHERKSICNSKSSSKAGLCSEERSLISPDYARNFICDFILGKKQKHTQLCLF